MLRPCFCTIFGHKVFKHGHLHRFVGHFVGQMGGDDKHAFAVAHQHVARPHGHVAAADGHVDVQRLVQRQVGRGAGAVVVAGKHPAPQFRANRESRRR
jgi:hypothetical protein